MRLRQTLVACTLCLAVNTFSQEVKISGEMRNVMKKGQLAATIHLDTISNKQNLYGLGPVEYLKGEIVVVDGKTYTSKLDENGKIIVKESFDAKAPFFVYANNERWMETNLPSSIHNLKELEIYIDKLTKDNQQPFVFRLVGIFKQVNFHIQNLPDGTIVKSPQDAHQGQGQFSSHDVSGELVGFFSRKHQAIFTHHDTFMHLHYINQDKTEMGHIDQVLFKGKVKLFLPKN